MRTTLLIVCGCFLLPACKSKDRLPEHILPKEKMEAVLRDMMRADQFLTDFVFSRDTSFNKKAESVRLYRKVLAIHQVSKEEFRESFSYYRSHPGLLKAVLDSIGLQEASVVYPYGKPDSTKSTDTSSAKQLQKPIPVE